MGARKPLMCLDGVPLLLHTLHRLCMARGCLQLVLAVHPDDIDDIRTCTEGLFAVSSAPPPTTIVEGGANRQESVMKALEATDPEAPLVLIHDAVRPLLRVEVVEAVARRAAESGAAIAAVPALATIKEVDGRGLIRSTPPRDRLWMAQTPQGFRRELALEAHRGARSEGFVGTDDAILAERLGHPVSVVRDRPDNIKITNPEDLAVAEAILAWQRRQGLPEAQPLSAPPPGP